MMNKTLIATGIALALGTTGAYAVGVNDVFGNASFTTNHANFTMLDGSGFAVGGTNDVAMTWDGDAFTDSSDYTGPGSFSNVTAASTQKFFGYIWTAHDIQVFTPGSYSFDTTIGGGNPEAGTLTATVGAGQLGMHMLFDWNGNLNIDVFVVASNGVVFGNGATASSADSGCLSTGGASITNCLWDGARTVAGFKPTADQIWMLASQDGNGDGISGIGMAAGGPFGGFNANFNANMDPIADVSDIPVSSVPVPAAAWLLGSGLIGLVGVARRKVK